MKLILSISLILFHFSSFGFGWSDWKRETPGGNSIDNYSSDFLSLNFQNTSIDSVQEFYFYKNHIVGRCGNNLEKFNTFFIADESKGSIMIYKLESDWNTYLVREDLTPKIWTRWYQTDWEIYNSEILLWIISNFILLISFFSVYILLIIWAFRKESFNIKKPITIAWLILNSIILIHITLDIFPQSI